MDCSPPGSSVHGIFQARMLEWFAIFYSKGSSRARDQTCISCISCISSGFFTASITWEALEKELKVFGPKASIIIIWSPLIIFLFLHIPTFLMKLILWLKFVHRQKPGRGQRGRGPQSCSVSYVPGSKVTSSPVWQVCLDFSFKVQHRSQSNPGSE